MATSISLTILGIGAAVTLYISYKLGQQYGKEQGFIEASEYFQEQEKYLNEMANGYCEYLAKEYERLKEELSLNRRVH